MRTSSLLLRCSTLLLALAVFPPTAPLSAATGTCQNCTPIAISPTTVDLVMAQNPNPASTDAATGLATFSTTLYPGPNRSLPAQLPGGTYQAWCATAEGDPYAGGEFTATTNLPASTIYPASLSLQTTWQQLTWLVNHKQGVTVGDVQVVFWSILGTYTMPLSAAQQTLLANATNPANYQSYTPGAGEHALVFLQTPNPGQQHLMIEVPACGMIGDRVWWDKDGDGIQKTVLMLYKGATLGWVPAATNTPATALPSETAAQTVFGMYQGAINGHSVYYGYQFTSDEPGISGVTVSLYDGSNNLIASTVTGPSPVSYPYLPAGTDGYYQFTGICPGTDYKVKIDNSQTPLSGLTPTSALALNGANPALDSNPNPAPVNIPTTTVPAVDETLDFGFTGVSPIVLVSCGTSASQYNTFYSSRLLVAGGVPAYTYALASGSSLPPGLTLNPSTGAVTGTPTATGTFNFRFTVTDSATPQSIVTLPDVNSSACSITVTAQPIGLSCASPSAQVSRSYNSSLTASGGVPPYTFSTNGSLPAGLTLDASTGAISGTPTVPGNVSFFAIVTDHNGATAGLTANTSTASCGINVASSGVNLACVNPTGTQGSFYSSRLVGSGSSSLIPLYSYSIDSTTPLPAWLSLNSTTGFITGTAPAPANVSFLAHVTDTSIGASASAQATCPITFSQPLVVSCVNPVSFVGLNYNSSFSVQGGTGNFTYKLDAALPPGVTLSGATASGTPGAPGTYPFTVTATDSMTGGTGTATCTVTSYSQPNLACNMPSTGVVGQPLTGGALVATGGYQHYTYGFSGTHPSWLAVNATTGAFVDPNNPAAAPVPTTVGTVSFIGQVTDGFSSSTAISSSSCNVDIKAALTLSCGVVAKGGEVGVDFQATVTAAGGIGPFTYSYTGTKPAELIFSPSADTRTLTISGKPSTTGTFVVIVTDTKTGAVATQTCSFTISAAPVSGCAAPTLGGEANAPFQAIVTASGGTPNYTYSFVGAAPAGLRLTPSADTTTVSISGTPTASGSFQVQVTDALGASSVSPCSYNIGQSPVISCGSAATGGEVNLPFSAAVTIAGGTAPYTAAFSDGRADLTLSVSGNTITVGGTPTVPGTFYIKVTDAAGAIVTSSCGYTIGSRATISCGTVSTGGEVNAPFSATVGAAGGIAPYTFSFAGTAPAGLGITPLAGTNTALIAGTPTAAGSFNVQITDAVGGTAVSACVYTIGSGPTISCSAPTTAAEAGLPFSASLTIAGGTGPYTISAVPSLPGGLTLNTATGTGGSTIVSISGTPAAAGTFQIKVVDAVGSVTTSGCSYSIISGPVPACTLINAVEGAPLQPVTVTATGGAGRYTFSSPDLARLGLAIDAATGVITGTPVVNGTYSYTVIVTDSAGGSTSISCAIAIAGGNNCGLTWGYWKNHTWPGYAAAYGLTIGGVPYTPAQLQAILATSVAGDGSLNLLHQLIAAKLNVYNGADATTDRGFIAAADALFASLYQGTVVTALNASFPQYTGVPLVSATNLGGLNIDSASTLGALMVNYSAQLDNFNSDGLWQPSCSIPGKLTVRCAAGMGQVGVAYNSAVVASGGIAPYSYSYTGTLPPGLTLDPATGALTGTPTQAGTYSFSVIVTDATNMVAGGAGSASTNCTIVIAPPPAILANCVTIVAVKGFPMAPVAMLASGGAGGPYTFSATGLPSGLSMSADGTISGTPTVSGTFSYTVTITDKSGNNTGTVNCAVTVNPPPTATCVAISLLAGVPMTPVTLSATGGTGALSFSAIGLPAGITISTAGTISGTPTVSGSFVYTVTVTDAKGNKGTSTCSVTVGISSNLCGLTWGYWKNHVSLWPVTGMILGNQSYSQSELQALLNTPVAGDASVEMAHQLIAAKFNVLHGTNPATDNGSIAAADGLLYNYSGKLPYGVASASTAGTQMTAVAAQLDTFNSDGAGQPGCGSGPSAMTVVCAASTGTVGVAYNSAIAASGGMGGPYTYTLVSGTLPAGLSLNPATGAITGIPTDDGVFTFSVLVADSSNNPGSAVGTKTTNCTITIVPTILCPTATAKVNETYASPVVLSGATGNYTLSIASGSLPPGLTLDPISGAIKGTPTAAGTYMFTIKATDTAAGVSLTSNCTITVAGPALALICPSSKAQTTIYYSSPVSASGGASPYVFSLTGGSLPPGITGNPSTGQIYGTPTATGTFTFTVKVTDTVNAYASTSCSIVVTTPTGTISAGMFTTYTQGGWGASPKGNNPGMFLSKNFAALFGTAGVTIGGTYSVKFGAATNIDAFLPQGGTAGVLKATATNPTTTAAGVFAGQVLALQLSVDFSNKGLTPGGLASLHVVSGKMAGYTVGQVLSIANQVLGGTTSALPAGVSVSDLNTVIDSINNNFDNGTSNNGYLKY